MIKPAPKHEPEVLRSNVAAYCRDGVERGVKLRSRYGLHGELQEMGRMVRALSDSLVLYMRSIICDSQAGSYCVQVMNCPRAIAEEIGGSLERASGGNNGIFIKDLSLRSGPALCGMNPKKAGRNATDASVYLFIGSNSRHSRAR